MGGGGERCILYGAGDFNSMPAISVNRNLAVRAPFTQWTSTVPQLVLLQLFIREQRHPSLLTLNTPTLCEKKHPRYQTGSLAPAWTLFSSGGASSAHCEAATCRQWAASPDMQITVLSEAQA